MPSSRASRMPIRALRDACPCGWPSVRSRAYERPDRMAESRTVAATGMSLRVSASATAVYSGVSALSSALVQLASKDCREGKQPLAAGSFVAVVVLELERSLAQFQHRDV